MRTRIKKNGFTLIELLVVIGIIAALMAILMPVANSARNAAKKVKQKAKINSIEMALETFKTDMGYYPPSDGYSLDGSGNIQLGTKGDYCGAQKLAEALVGWDLLGFHPDTWWQFDGYVVYPDLTSGYYGDVAAAADAGNTNLVESLLSERRGPYLEAEGAKAYMLGDIYKTYAGPITPLNQFGNLNAGGYLLCDEFGIKDITLTYKTGQDAGNLIPGKGGTAKAGSPILYYRANTASKLHNTGANYYDNIYNFDDNIYLIDLKKIDEPGTAHSLTTQTDFYNYIKDPKASGGGLARPYRHDTFLLISAGLDGLYGTGDDICNFGK